MEKTVILVTGGFDPLHSGHIAYFKAAKEIGDYSLCVGVNSDAWLTRKKGKPFMTIDERVSIIKELKCVDVVIEFRDHDDSACDAIDWHCRYMMVLSLQMVEIDTMRMYQSMRSSKIILT